MKIQSAITAFSSNNQFEQMDLSFNKKTRKQSVSQNRSGQSRIQLNRAMTGDSQPLPRIIVDRVSIQQNKSMEYQSNYSAQISSHSSVKSLSSDKNVEYAQQYAMEKLVGGIIDKHAVISRIQRKEDIPLSNSKGIIPETLQSNTAGDRTQNQTSREWNMSLTRTDIHFEDQSVQFASKGQVATEDGRTIDFSLDMSLNRSFLSRREEQTLVHRWQETISLTDPLIISLNGKVPQLSDARFEFDLNSDGKAENINFVSPGSGFLAFDKNHDNRINDGSELFGPGTGNGFEELAAYDQDQNHWIDENDAVFSQLSVWTKDDQGNDQLISLKDAGLGAIALDYAATTFSLTGEDNVLQGKLQRTGVFLFENGQVGSVQQIDLASHEPEPVQECETTNPQNLLNSSPAPAPQMFQSVPVTEQPGSEDAANPLKDLKDRIEKLKKEMAQLFESMNPVTT